MIRNLENLIIKVGDVDRRVIFVLIGLAVLIPLLTPVSLPIRETPTTVKFYEGIEEIPKGSKVLVSFDYGPSTRPEIHRIHILFLKIFHPFYLRSLFPLFRILSAINYHAIQLHFLNLLVDASHQYFV